MASKRYTKLSILLALAGVVACDSTKKLEEAREEQAETTRNAAEERAELNREQTKERAELNQDTRQEATGEMRDLNGVAVEQQREAQKLQQEHAKENAELAKDTREDMNEANREVAQAKVEVDRDRADITAKSRERLTKLDARAKEIKEKSAMKAPATVSSVNQELTTFERTWNEAERDVDALSTIAAENVNRAQKALDQKFSQLEKTLDRAESKL